MGGPLREASPLREVLPQLFFVLAHLIPADGDRATDPVAGRLGDLFGRPADFDGQRVGLEATGRLLNRAAYAALDPQR